MDAKLKEVLKGGPEKKKKRDDRLKTETGEELLFAEFADMSVVFFFRLVFFLVIFFSLTETGRKPLFAEFA